MNRWLPLLSVLAFACNKERDHDSDGVVEGDCAPYDAQSSPDAVEVCDGRDNDCDGSVDEDVDGSTVWFADVDKDGFGDDASGAAACFPSGGTIPVGGDCDDADPGRHPGASEACTVAADLNCDGESGLVDMDQDGSAACLDCDDASAAVHPGAPESCNAADDDCDGVDDEAAVDAPTWFVDLDGDGAGSDRVFLVACAAPMGFVGASDDCDDLNADAHPGGAEVCDGADNDCDGTVDEDATGALIWYRDRDGDAYGDSAAPTEACVRPGGYSANADDCDDGDPLVNPIALETCGDAIDRNCDGLVGLGDGDGDGVSACKDCDDTRTDVHVGANEICDGADNDCDGAIDEAAPIWFMDADRDGHGSGSFPMPGCVAPQGYVVLSDDCDDVDASRFPGAAELCDGRDNDCLNGVPALEADVDGDGFRGCSGDCDDLKASAHPGGVEVCNAEDDDCDGAKDNGSVDAERWYTDADADGYGAGAGSLACAQPAGTAAVAGDCDDASSAVSPLAMEVCNAKDDDCDGQSDEEGASGGGALFFDADGDGFGGATAPVSACAAPAGYVATSTDCDDTRASAHPGAVEVCNLVDDDCDGTKDDAAVDASRWYLDADGDGHGNSEFPETSCAPPARHVALADDCDDTEASAYPGAPEVWYDGIDEDCDGGDDYDQDSDGEPSFEYGRGDDCDDMDPLVTTGCVQECLVASVRYGGSGGGLSGNPNGLRTYTYDAAGNVLTDDLDSDFDGDIDVHEESTYDPNGHVLTWYYQSESTDTLETNTYDISGNLLIKDVDYNGPNGTPDSRTTRTYDAMGNELTTEVDSAPVDGTLARRVTMTYDATGHLLTSVVDNPPVDGSINYRYRATYDAQGNRLTQGNDLDGDGSFDLNYAWKYTYDSSDKLLTSASDDGANGTFEYSDTRDANGNVTTFVQDGDLDGAVERQGTNTYDADGRLLTADVDYGDFYFNDPPSIHHRDTYTYDADGNVLSHEAEGATSPFGTAEHYKDTYLYDAYGNVLTHWYDLGADGALERTWTFGYTYECQ